MLRTRFVCGALLGALALLLGAPVAQATDRPLASAPLGAGVSHDVWPVDGSTARVHLARVEPGSAARLVVVQAAGGVVGGRETPSAMCRRTRGCVVALNGDFFTADGPVGAVVADGRMLRSPRPDHEQLSVQPLRATTGGLGADGWAARVEAPGADPLPLDGINVALPPDGAVLYTGAYGGQSPVCTCVELVLSDPAGRLGRLGEPAAVTAIGRGAGATALSAGVAVIAATGAGAERLAQVADAGLASLLVTVQTAQPTRHNLGAHPVLLRDGRPAPVDEADPMLSDRHPRTAVAWDTGGRVWLAAFDGRQPGGPGPTARETLSFLQRLGATDAVLLDGGGSTSLATPSGPLNLPSDGAERPVSNAVLVVAPPSKAALRTPPAPAPPVVAEAVVPARVVVAVPPQPRTKPARVRPAAPPKARPARAAPAPPVVLARTFPRAAAERAAVELTAAVRPATAAPRAAPTTPEVPPVAVAVALVLLSAAAWGTGVAACARGRATT